MPWTEADELNELNELNELFKDKKLKNHDEIFPDLVIRLDKIIKTSERQVSESDTQHNALSNLISRIKEDLSKSPSLGQCFSALNELKEKRNASYYNRIQDRGGRTDPVGHVHLKIFQAHLYLKTILLKAYKEEKEDIEQTQTQTRPRPSLITHGVYVNPPNLSPRCGSDVDDFEELAHSPRIPAV